MRPYRDPQGRKQFWYTEDEIEAAMSEVLNRRQGATGVSDVVPDIEDLLEQGLGVVLDQYADLARDLLGVTQFSAVRTVVQINKDLTGAADADNAPPVDRARWRSTLAHEAAHVILHKSLFEVNENQESLFDLGSADDGSTYHCLKRAVGVGVRSSDPREYQANLGMAALLMPREPFLETARRLAATMSGNGRRLGPSTVAANRLSLQLARQFAVSRQAAEIRLDGLGFLRVQAEL